MHTHTHTHAHTQKEWPRLGNTVLNLRSQDNWFETNSSLIYRNVIEKYFVCNEQCKKSHNIHMHTCACAHTYTVKSILCEHIF